MYKERIDIAIIGFGNVGSKVYEIIIEKRDEIFKTTSCEINIAHVLDYDMKRTSSLPDTIVRKKLSDIKQVDLAIVVSIGIESTLEAILYFLQQQCPVITSSRDCLLTHIEEIYNTAENNGVDIYFEATVGGKIPIVEHIRRGYGILGIDEIYGIVHGSTNFILTSMFDNLRRVDELSLEAYNKGFSPTGSMESIEGKGTRDKMLILSGLAYNSWVDSKKVEFKGIGDIKMSDVAYAVEFGYQIRHIGITKKLNHGIMISAQPMMIPNESRLANVKEENNIIIIHGEGIGEITLQGSGAGGMSTAISVVCDVIEVIRNLSQGINKRYSYCYHCAEFLSDLSQDYPFYLRVASHDIIKMERDIKDSLSQGNISITNFIKSVDKGPGEISLITSIVRKDIFMDIIKDIQNSLKNGESLKYLPILLK